MGQMQVLQSQLEFQEQSMVEKSLANRQEAKIRELETKMEFEKSQVKRLEVRSQSGTWVGKSSHQYVCTQLTTKVCLCSVMVLLTSWSVFLLSSDELLWTIIQSYCPQ